MSMHAAHRADDHFDYVLVGGGLQNGLLALALRNAQPAARIAVLERGAALGGNHTWSFHDDDLPVAARPWVAPLVEHRWSAYEVAFPAHRRVLASGYAAITSERLHRAVTAALDVPHCRIALRTEVAEVGAHAVVATGPDGASIALRGRVVVDARGPDRGASQVPQAGFQKFWGREVGLDRPHGLAHPMLMDATVEQIDGFRFLYVLPLGPDRLLVEDTYFSDRPYLDGDVLRARIDAYIAARGWQVTRVYREESGVLPLPWHMQLAAPTAPLVAGYQGGWFHPVTGYSFPLAVRLASFVAARPADALFGAELDTLARGHRKQLGFALRLNWMLFRWFAPQRRYHVLERFYRLPEPTIRRFYALELTALDRARILVGRPPRGMSWRAALALGKAS
jgi:lycopene beta-cyclase